MPGHSTFSKNRHGRFRDSDLLRRLFEATVRRCTAEGIVGGRDLAVDASMVRADASRQKGVASPGDLDPEDASRAVGEYSAVLDDSAFGAASGVPPKLVSPADPAARWTAAASGPACYACCDNHLVDVGRAVIVDVEATTAVRQAEVAAARTMLTRTAEAFGLWPERLVADTGHGSAAMPGWLVHEQGIEPRIPVFDKSARRGGTFSRGDFRYDHEGGVYLCPAGKMVSTRGSAPNDDQVMYWSSTYDCAACSLKLRCCPGKPSRPVPHSICESARLGTRHRQDGGLRGPERERKKVEMLFAHCGCGARPAPATSSTSPLPPRTSASSPG